MGVSWPPVLEDEQSRPDSDPQPLQRRWIMLFFCWLVRVVAECVDTLANLELHRRQGQVESPSANRKAD